MSKKEKTNEEIAEEVEQEIENQEENISKEVNTDAITPDEEEVLLLKDKIKNLEDKVKQTQAELINYRKRKDEEVSNMLKYANMDIIMDILPIVDNFERALKIQSDNPEFIKFIEGFKILYTHLLDVLKKYGVEEIPSTGVIFDPNLHEALMVGEESDKEDNIILETFLKGYKLKERIIRPAKVKVNKLS